MRIRRPSVLVMTTRGRRCLASGLASAGLLCAAALPAAAHPLAPPSVGRALGTGIDGQFSGVAAIGPDDVWAVGAKGNVALHEEAAAIYHWNGATWSKVPSPHPAGAGTYSSLNAVAAVSPSDVYAAGWFQRSTGARLGLVLHYDGAGWQRLHVTDLRGAIWTGVSADGPNDVWLVGADPRQTLGLVEHWDGQKWRGVQTSPISGDHRFFGIKAISADDVWVVGSQDERVPVHTYTLIEHWNGAAWSAVTSQDPDNLRNNLYAVEASGGSVWTAGEYGGGGGGGLSTERASGPLHQRTRTLVETLVKGTWVVQSTPSPSSPDELFSLAATSPDDVWAAGYSGLPNSTTLMLHWDGSVWSQVDSPSGDAATELLDVSADAGTDAWAVGFIVGGGNGYATWVEHWNGTAWQVG